MMVVNVLSQWQTKTSGRWYSYVPPTPTSSPDGRTLRWEDGGQCALRSSFRIPLVCSSSLTQLFDLLQGHQEGDGHPASDDRSAAEEEVGQPETQVQGRCFCFFPDSQAADISCLVWTPETALFVGCTSDLVAVIIYTGRMKQKYLSIKTGSP